MVTQNTSPRATLRLPVRTAPARRRLLLLLLAALAVLAAAWVPPPLTCPPPDEAALERLRTSAPAVQLWAAPISYLGSRVVHPHFLYIRPEEEQPHRVEVWQRADGPHDHIWVDQNGPLHDQGRGLCLLGERSGAEAEAVIAAIEDAIGGSYPWQRRYFPVPGPNSNTFAATILRRSGWALPLPQQAIGRRFPQLRRSRSRWR